jgi:hypothetical protein
MVRRTCRLLATALVVVLVLPVMALDHEEEEDYDMEMLLDVLRRTRGAPGHPVPAGAASGAPHPATESQLSPVMGWALRCPTSYISKKGGTACASTARGLTSGAVLMMFHVRGARESQRSLGS